MSFFVLLLLFIFGYFIVWPVVRTLMRVNQARRQFSDMMNGAYGPRRPSSSTRRPDAAPRRREKKISRDTGEYVAFEDISCNVSSESSAGDNAGKESFVAEQQVVDVEWEDVK
ncbi:MAG: hypothetical protein HDS11_02120 [Bacteroides sp.]|nr:hypothetical protein [Bacteroides sp.]